MFLFCFFKFVFVAAFVLFPCCFNVFDDVWCVLMLFFKIWGCLQCNRFSCFWIVFWWLLNAFDVFLTVFESVFNPKPISKTIKNRRLKDHLIGWIFAILDGLMDSCFSIFLNLFQCSNIHSLRLLSRHLAQTHLSMTLWIFGYQKYPKMENTMPQKK